MLGRGVLDMAVLLGGVEGGLGLGWVYILLRDGLGLDVGDVLLGIWRGGLVGIVGGLRGRRRRRRERGLDGGWVVVLVLLLLLLLALPLGAVAIVGVESAVLWRWTWRRLGRRPGVADGLSLDMGVLSPKGIVWVGWLGRRRAGREWGLLRSERRRRHKWIFVHGRTLENALSTPTYIQSSIYPALVADALQAPLPALPRVVVGVLPGALGL